jgi:hypothetical protein
VSGRHAPRQLDRYRSIHEAAMQRFRNLGFVESDTLAFQKVGGGVMSLCGDISCAGGLAIDVTKFLNVTDGEGSTSMVQTFEYSYDAHVEGLTDGNIFRYCSPHDHRPAHHRHQYDLFGTMKEDRAQLKEVADDDWPTLGKVIDELRHWYYNNLVRYEALQLRSRL